MKTAEKIILVSFLLQGVCCRDFSVSLPEKIEALSGSCVIIKCTFEIEDKYDKDLTERATGCWHKDGTKFENIVFKSSMSGQNSIIKGNITGRLHMKDCTTIFYDVRSNYNGAYYFRIEGDGGLKYTYSGAHVQIAVIESPRKPTVKLYVEQKELQDQEVLEGISVNLRCSAEILCSSPPPTLTWSSTPRIPLNESSRQRELISDLSFTATHRHHRVTFTCTITYQLLDQKKTTQDNITLHVQYSPKSTSVSVLPSGSVLEGSSVTMICSSDANPEVLNYTWTRKSEGQLKQLQTGETLAFNRTDPTQRGLYQCTAQNKHGTQESSVILDIQYAPKISPSSSCNRTGVPVYVCEVDGNPFPELEWHLSGRPVTNSSNTFISEERLSSTSLRSSITLQSLTHTSTLECVGSNTRARKMFQLNLCPPERGQHLFSISIGVAVGVSLMMMIVCIGIFCARRKNLRSSKQEDTTGIIMTDRATQQEGESESVYANYAMLSPAEAATLNHQESLHYASIDFKNIKPESEEIRGISSLTTDYAVIRYSPLVGETKGSVGRDEPNSNKSQKD